MSLYFFDIVLHTRDLKHFWVHDPLIVVAKSAPAAHRHFTRPPNNRPHVLLSLDVWDCMVFIFCIFCYFLYFLTLLYFLVFSVFLIFSVFSVFSEFVIFSGFFTCIFCIFCKFWIFSIFCIVCIFCVYVFFYFCTFVPLYFCSFVVLYYCTFNLFYFCTSVQYQKNKSKWDQGGGGKKKGSWIPGSQLFPGLVWYYRLRALS